MPNWVYNTLTIQGPKNEVDMIKDRLNKPFTLAQETYGMGDISANGFPTKITQVSYSNPVFSFHNIHSYKDDGITDEEYACQPNRGGIDTQNDPDWFRKSVEFAKTQKDWYSWNTSNWGTKWDVAVRDEDEYPNTELLEYKSEGDDNWVVYKYETAWSPAVTILTKLSNLVPNCVLTLEFEEETGWGGEYEIVRGNVTELVEYDNQCRDCDSYNTLDYCENECGEICSNCNWLGEADLEAVAECQTHAIYLETKVPEYRKVES
jgi:Ferredoxin-like domain in Api92-like protein